MHSTFFHYHISNQSRTDFHLTVGGRLTSAALFHFIFKMKYHYTLYVLEGVNCLLFIPIYHIPIYDYDIIYGIDYSFIWGGGGLTCPDEAKLGAKINFHF